VAAVSSAGGRNEGFSERHGGQVVGKRKKRAIQLVARRGRGQPEKETSVAASGVAGKRLTGEKNK
jgi:hypothetical protein